MHIFINPLFHSNQTPKIFKFYNNSNEREGEKEGKSTAQLIVRTNLQKEHPR